MTKRKKPEAIVPPFVPHADSPTLDELSEDLIAARDALVNRADAPQPTPEEFAALLDEHRRSMRNTPACAVCGTSREMMKDAEPCQTCGKQLEDAP